MSVMTEQTIAAPIDGAQEIRRGFSRYQAALIGLLALVQFTIILDFTIMSPLGAIIMPSLGITAAQFGVAVSAYAFSAGISLVRASRSTAFMVVAGFSVRSSVRDTARSKRKLCKAVNR